MNERRISITDLNNYTSQLSNLRQDIVDSMNKFSQGLNNLYAAGIIEGARVNPLEEAHGMVKQTASQVSETLTRFENFVKNDVAAEGQNLESSQANELGNMIAGMTAFKN